MKRKLLKRILKTALLSLLFLVASCASIPDKPFFVDETPSQGFGVYLISGKQIHVNDTELFTDEKGIKHTWYDMQLGMIKIPLETFKAMKKYFIENCKKSNQCSEKIDSWDRNISVLENKATGGN